MRENLQKNNATKMSKSEGKTIFQMIPIPIAAILEHPTFQCPFAKLEDEVAEEWVDYEDVEIEDVDVDDGNSDGDDNEEESSDSDSDSDDDDDDLVFNYSSSANSTSDDLFVDSDTFQPQSVDSVEFLAPPPCNGLGKNKAKKVSFNEDQLESVMEFEDDQESKCARETYWEMLARDRCRFQDRICRTEDILLPILSASHRSRIFQERFVQEDSS